MGQIFTLLLSAFNFRRTKTAVGRFFCTFYVISREINKAAKLALPFFLPSFLPRPHSAICLSLSLLRFPLMFFLLWSARAQHTWNGQSPFPINFPAAVCFSSLMQRKWERKRKRKREMGLERKELHNPWKIGCETAHFPYRIWQLSSHKPYYI